MMVDADTLGEDPQDPPIRMADKAYEALTHNYQAIRRIVETYCCVVGGGHGIMGPSKYTPEQFDQAYQTRDDRLLTSIMNDAWFRAPDRRGVYNIPGFQVMCNILDGTYGDPTRV